MEETPVTLVGQVLLPGGRERDCLFRSLRADEMHVMVGDAEAPVGSRVVCRVDGLGRVEASVAAVLADGVRLSVMGSPAHRARLTARLAWHRTRIEGGGEQRVGERVEPVDPAVSVILPDGSVVHAHILDVSVTGAALETTHRPPVGDALTVGRRRAHVVRHTEAGVAVRFVMPLRPQDVGPHTRL